MKSVDLNESFITVLKEKFPKQPALITAVEDILKIERESAYRRIKGSVQFSVREMGILAQHLNISLDDLLIDNQTNVVHIDMLSPRMEDANKKRTIRVQEYLSKVKIIVDSPDGEMGVTYSNLPMEFYTPYHNLFKFIYFRWGNYYIGSEKYKNFTKFKLPGEVINYHSNVMTMFANIKKMLYVWDKAIIWDLVKDVKYFASAGMIEEEDVSNLKNDLHNMLNDLEKLVADGGPKNDSEKIEFYISHVKIGITYSYLWSEKYAASYITTLYMFSTINENRVTCSNVRNWIKSLRKVSTLISGTGDKERMLFFKEQHQIVDSI